MWLQNIPKDVNNSSRLHIYKTPDDALLTIRLVVGEQGLILPACFGYLCNAGNKINISNSPAVSSSSIREKTKKRKRRECPDERRLVEPQQTVCLSVAAGTHSELTELKCDSDMFTLFHFRDIWSFCYINLDPFSCD